MNTQCNTLGKGMVAGFVATIVLSLLMIAKSIMGFMPDLNVITMLSSMAHAYMGVPQIMLIGWMLHFAIGTVVWGILFVLLTPHLPGTNTVVKGLIFGTIAWLAMMIVVMPMVGAGLFGWEFGMMAPVATWMLHLSYGAVLGYVYGRLTGACRVGAKPADDVAT